MNLKAHIRENVGFCFACHRRCNHGSIQQPFGCTQRMTLLINPAATPPDNGRCHRFAYELQHE